MPESQESLALERATEDSLDPGSNAVSAAPSIVQSGAYPNLLGGRQITQSLIVSILPAGQAQLHNLWGLGRSFCFPRVPRCDCRHLRSTLGYDPPSLRDWNQHLERL